MKRQLSQQEIDAVFQGTGESGHDQEPEAASFDFRRLDRIPKSQVRALHLVHENFVRSLASSLSAYLRAFLVVNLISLEQISYSEFQETLAMPTCLAYIGLQPFDGTAVLELNLGVMFAMVELLLGKKGQHTAAPQRKITDIEKSLVQALMKLVLRDLGDAWKSVADVTFHLQDLASEPLLLHVLAPAEAVIVIAMEVKVEGTSGLMNLAVPSIFIKRLRTRLDLMRPARKVEPTEADQLHIARLLEPAQLAFQAWIDGGQISGEDLINLKVDDVLMLDHPQAQCVSASVNDRHLWSGKIVSRNDRMAFQVGENWQPNN